MSRRCGRTTPPGIQPGCWPAAQSPRSAPFADFQLADVNGDLKADLVGFQQANTDPPWPLHNALMRNLGVTLTEIAWLDDLAADCAADGQYTFLYAAAPLKVVNATGAPVNPIVIK